MICDSSVALLFRNFLLAGVLKKISLTSTVVPLTGGASEISILRLTPSSTFVPVPDFSGAVTTMTLETDAIDERASPLNPRVVT